LKPSTPWGQLPIIEIDKKTTIGQSGTIARYVARLAGLGGSTPLEAAQIESIHDAVGDLGTQYAKAFFSGTDEENKKVAEENAKTHFPTWAGRFEARLKANNGGKGFFVGNSITLADIAVYAIFSDILNHQKEALAHFPLLSGLVERVGKSEKIAAWVAKRPKTPF